MDSQHEQQTKYLEKEINRVDSDVKSLWTAFTEHVKVYRENNKELARLAVLSEMVEGRLQENSSVLQEIQKTHRSDHEKIVAEVNSLEKDVSRLIVKIGFVVSLGSAALSSLAVFLIDKLLV